MQLQSGIYAMDSITINAGDTLEGIGRVIITRSDGKPPRVVVGAGATVQNVWIGGTKDTGDNAIVAMETGVSLDNVALFGYYGGIGIGSAKGARVSNCVLANCGTDDLWHPIYISNSAAQAGEGTTFERNIILGGEGYAIHLWHHPAYNTLHNNFVAANRGMAQQGNDNTWTRNVFWSNGKYPCVYIQAEGARLKFTWNLIGAVTTNHILEIPTDATVRNNGFIAPAVPFGKSPQTYDNVRGLLGYSQASITNSVTALTASFGQTPQALLIDATIDAHIDKLRDVLAHWSVAA